MPVPLWVASLLVTFVAVRLLLWPCARFALDRPDERSLHSTPAPRMGRDVGSISLGFLVGALGVVGWRDDVWPLWFPLLLFWPFHGRRDDAVLSCLDATDGSAVGRSQPVDRAMV